MSSRALVAALALALALRAWPLHVPYLHPDQEMIPTMALRALDAGSWRPDSLVYPSGLFTLLRAAYGAADAALRLDDPQRPPGALAAAAARDPFPFLLVGRVLACVAGVAGVALTGALAATVAGPRAALAAALVLAVAPLHVRDAHYGSIDVPATTGLTAALLALAVAARARRPLRALLAAGACAGVAAAFRYHVAGVAPAAVAVALALPAPSRVRAARAAATGLAALATFALLSPYALLEPGRALADLRAQAFVTWLPVDLPTLPLHTLLLDAVGTPACLLALPGVALLAWRRPRATAVAALAVAPYVATLLTAHRLFARYVLPLLPLVAVAAGAALDAGARALAPRVRPPAFALGLALALAAPLARSVAIARLLGREDTRRAAGRWIVAHVPAGARLAVPGPGYYANPVLPAGRYRLVGYAIDGSAFDPAHPPAAWLVTEEHPGLPSQGTVPRALADWLAAHATPVARFDALAPGAPIPQFDAADANYVPLAGLAGERAPGPNLVVWRLTAPPREASGPPP